jgi:hypothetical protein
MSFSQYLLAVNQQLVCRYAPLYKSLISIGAGEGNRTLVSILAFIC